jgi:NADH:ubiquinone oxidoreductase subunit
MRPAPEVHEALFHAHLNAATHCSVLRCASLPAMDLGTRPTIFLRGRLVGSDAFGNCYYLEKFQPRGTLRARRWVKSAGEKEASARYPQNGTPGCTTRLTRQSRKPASILAKATSSESPRHAVRPVTTIAAVIEPPQTAVMNPGRQAVSEALPQSWQRCSRQALVRRMS